MAGSVLPTIKQQYLTNAGIPAVGHLLFSWAAGTSTPLALYSDAALTTPHTNPIVLDAAGRATVFADAVDYKLALAAPGDTVPTSPLWTVDGVGGAGASNLPWVRNVGAGTTYAVNITDKVGIGTAAPTKMFSVAEKFTIDSNGRALSNTVATYDLGSNTLAANLCLDPNGQAGNSGFGGSISPASGMNVRLISLSGTMGAIAPAAITEFSGLSFNFKNEGTGINAAMRGILGAVTLTAGGHARGAYFRTIADTGATGYMTSILAAVDAAAAQPVGNAIAILVQSTAVAARAYGIQFTNTAGNGWAHGIVFGDDFEASGTAIRLRQATTHGKVAWGGSLTPYIESSTVDHLIINAATPANVRVGIGKAPAKALHVLGVSGAVGSFPTLGANDALVLENNGAIALAFAIGATSIGSFKWFGSGDAAEDAEIQYSRNTRNMTFKAAATDRVRITSAGSLLTQMAGALATTATDGHLYVPTCAGVPTGVPTTQTGMAALIVDTTNNNLYVYSGGAWRDCTV